MNFKNILNDKIIVILLILFAFLAVVDIIFSSLVQRAIMADGQIWFISILDKLSNGANYAYESLWGIRPRGFINAANALFINIGYMLGIKSKYWLGVLFSMPHFLFTFLVLVWHFLLTFRSKRVDIFLSALILYTTLIVPISFYAICEISLAVSLTLLLFHYLCAEIKYNVWDCIAILILSFAIYLSTEAFAYLGFIFFGIAVYYVKKSDNRFSKCVKAFIGINCLISAIFQIYMYKYFHWDYVSMTRANTEMGGIISYLNGIEFFADILILLIFLIILFKKTKIKLPSFALLCCLGAFLFLLFFKDNFYLYVNLFVRRFFPYVIIPILIIINFILGINIHKISKDRINSIMYNSIIWFLIVGCVFNILSILDSKHFDLVVEKFEKQISSYENTIIDPDKQLAPFFDGVGERYFNCDTYTYSYLDFVDDYKLSSLISPDLDGNGCAKIMYFNNTKLRLSFGSLSLKNEFWDITKVKEIVEKNPKYKATYNAKNFSVFDQTYYKNSQTN